MLKNAVVVYRSIRVANKDFLRRFFVLRRLSTCLLRLILFSLAKATHPLLNDLYGRFLCLDGITLPGFRGFRLEIHLQVFRAAMTSLPYGKFSLGYGLAQPDRMYRKPS